MDSARFHFAKIRHDVSCCFFFFPRCFVIFHIFFANFRDFFANFHEFSANFHEFPRFFQGFLNDLRTAHFVPDTRNRPSRAKPSQVAHGEGSCTHARPAASEKSLHSVRRKLRSDSSRMHSAARTSSDLGAVATPSQDQATPWQCKNLAAYGGGGAKAPNSMRSEVVKCAELRMMGAN